MQGPEENQRFSFLSPHLGMFDRAVAQGQTTITRSLRTWVIVLLDRPRLLGLRSAAAKEAIQIGGEFIMLEDGPGKDVQGVPHVAYGQGMVGDARMIDACAGNGRVSRPKSPDFRPRATNLRLVPSGALRPRLRGGGAIHCGRAALPRRPSGRRTRSSPASRNTRDRPQRSAHNTSCRATHSTSCRPRAARSKQRKGPGRSRPPSEHSTSWMPVRPAHKLSARSRSTGQTLAKHTDSTRQPSSLLELGHA